MEKMRY